MYIIVTTDQITPDMRASTNVCTTDTGTQALNMPSSPIIPSHHITHLAIYEQAEYGHVNQSPLLYYDKAAAEPLWNSHLPAMLPHVDTPPLASWPRADPANCDGMEEPPTLDRVPDWGDVDELEPPALAA